MGRLHFGTITAPLVTLFPRRGRAPYSGRPDAVTLELARYRTVESGVFRPAPQEGGVSAIAVDPLIAAVVPAETYMRQIRQQWTGWSRPNSTLGTVRQWEREVFRMMRTGPGFVGQAAKMYGDWLAGSGRLVMQERAGQDATGADAWKDTDWAPAVELLAMWRGEDKTQADLIRETMTLLDSVGQLYQTLRKTGGGWVYDLWAHTAVRGNPETGMIECRGVPDAQPGDHWFREVVPQLVDHLFLADDEWKGVPTSQFQRVMTDIYRLILAERAMDRDNSSRLVDRGILWGEATPGGANWGPTYAQWAGQAYSGAFDEDYMPGLSGRLEEVAPFVLISQTKPEYIDLSRHGNPTAAEVHRMAWEAICIGLDMPKGAMDGNEAASRWSGFLNRDEEALKAAAPRMQRLAAMVQRSHVEPWWRTLNLGRPLSDFRVWYVLPDVRPERTQEKISVAPMLGPTRAALAGTVGWSESDLVELPEGWCESDWWVFQKTGKAPDSGAPDAGSPLAPGLNEPTFQPVMPTPGAAGEHSTMIAAPSPGETAAWELDVP